MTKGAGRMSARRSNGAPGTKKGKEIGEDTANKGRIKSNQEHLERQISEEENTHSKNT